MIAAWNISIWVSVFFVPVNTLHNVRFFRLKRFALAANNMIALLKGLSYIHANGLVSSS